VDVGECIVGSIVPGRPELTVDGKVGIRLPELADGIVGRVDDTAALS
jgi:hypothetical protein